ncbi:carbonic anhydrase family protein [Nocardia sp. NPDC050710]|uniref:carbonic anhydrase n=1 Tax=Nocardia sp. NPDC050710 TaxID=3157220 RepID=UPI0033E1D240
MRKCFRRPHFTAAAVAAIAILALPACSSGANEPQANPAPHTPAHWDYDAEGPDHWADLDRDFLVCQRGHQQSPIDLASRIRLSPRDHITIEYAPVPSVELVNNGHTVQANLPAGNGNRILVDATPFELVQFHFHLPSEHTVDGVGTTMELHLVHKSAAGALAVLGVLLQARPGASPFAAVLGAAPAQAEAAITVAGPVDPRAFLPTDPDQFRYQGSLTTPPCSEGVSWTVLRTPVGVAAAEADRYRELFPHSNRPTQPLHERTVTLAGK